MADLLRIVSMGITSRPIVELDLNDNVGFFRDRSAEFTFTPPASTVQYSKRARRYGGGRAVGETHDNGTIGWTAYVKGATLLQATQRAEDLLDTIQRTARGRYVEWAPEGGKSSFMEIAGPGTWVPVYNPVEFVQTNAMRIQLTFPVLPLVRWAPTTIVEDYISNGIGLVASDWTYDALTSSDMILNGIFSAGASPTLERRLRHTARGYLFREGAATLRLSVGFTITNFKAGVILRGMSATSYIEVYVDDNGTNSRLRVDVVTSGSRVNRASVNLGSRLTAGQLICVRGRVENSTVYAELYTAGSYSALFTASGPLSTATQATSYALSGTEITNFDPGGYAGWSWIPQDVNSQVMFWSYEPFYIKGSTGRAVPFVSAIFNIDQVPGNAPALANVNITTSGATNPPAFAMLGWTTKPRASVFGTDGFGALAANGATLTNLSTGADANALMATAASDATVSGAETYVLMWGIDPTVLPPDEFGDELNYEFWVRVAMSSTIVSPIATLSARSSQGSQYGATRYTQEWGSAGKRLVQAASGAFYSMYRLGSISLPSDPLNRLGMNLLLTVVTGAGSTGTIGFDYILGVPTRARALSPTGKELDSAYPLFISSTSHTTKSVRPDLSAITRQGGTLVGMVDHGLGGALLEVPPGVNYWTVKLSDQVPDDPTPTAAHEALSYNAVVSWDYVPRSFFLRDDS